MYTDSTGKYAVANTIIRPNYNFNLQLIAKDLPFANVVNRFSYTQSLIKYPFIAALIGNLSYITSVQPQNLGWLYAYSDIGNGFVGHGSGINLGGVVGFEFGVTAGSFWDFSFNVSVNLGPLSVGGSIGTSGIGVNFGVTIGNTTHTVGGTIGWGPVAFATALALIPIPGARIAAVFTLFFAWLF